MQSDFGALSRLARVEGIHVRVPFRRALLDATGEYTHRRSWLLRVVDEDGTEGLGEAALNPFAEEVTTSALARLMREIVPALAAGRAPGWAELSVEGEPGRAAMAAVEGAIGALACARGADTVDERATTARDASVPVSATITFAGAAAGADAAEQAVELGFETLKLRAGFERTTDQLVDRLRAIRGAVGPEPRLRVDAGGAWDLETATERIQAIESFRIEFVEQPLAAWDMIGHAALRERVRVPIALDESIDSEGSARAALAEGAADVLVVKPARVGGRSATMRIAEAASASGATIVLGTYMETGVGIAAALRIAADLSSMAPAGARAGARAGRPAPGRASAPETAPAHALATSGVLANDLLVAALAIEDGWMAVPDAVSLDEAIVERYATERFDAEV